MIEGVHIKEVGMAIISAAVGYIGWKAKRASMKQDQAEQEQNTRLDNLERRQQTIEKDFERHLGILDERTKTTRDDIQIIKEHLLRD